MNPWNYVLLERKQGHGDEISAMTFCSLDGHIYEQVTPSTDGL